MPYIKVLKFNLNSQKYLKLKERVIIWCRAFYFSNLFFENLPPQIP
jgi:hypothetical protein